METPTDPPPKDSDDVRLRRFTMGMGIVFVLMTCGKAKLVKEGEATLPIFGNKIILENPEFIYWLIVISTFYALGLFCYRNLYLKNPPWQVKGLLKKYGVLIWLSDAPGVLNAHASLSSIALQSHDRETDVNVKKKKKNSVNESRIWWKELM